MPSFPKKASVVLAPGDDPAITINIRMRDDMLPIERNQPTKKGRAGGVSDSSDRELRTDGQRSTAAYER